MTENPMLTNPAEKYRPSPVLARPDRHWPNNTLTPTSGLRLHSDNAAQNMQQLGAVVLMPRFAITVRIIMGKRDQRPTDKGKR